MRIQLGEIREMFEVWADMKEQADMTSKEGLDK